MGVVSVNPGSEGREAEKTITGRNYTRSWVVILDSPTDAELQSRLAVESYDPTVFIGAQHPLDSYAILQKITPRKRENTRLVWDVYAYYDRGTIGRLEAQQVDLPQIRNADIEFGFNTYEVPLLKDFSDPPLPIVNSVGQSFDPQLTVTQFRPTLVVRQAELRTIENQALFIWNYNNTVNRDKFLGADEHQLRVRITSQRVTEANGYYFYTTYELEYHPTTWDAEGLVRDEGYHERVSIAQPPYSALVRIGGPMSTMQSADDEPVADPWPLNGMGGALSVTAAMNPENHVYLSFLVYKESNFTNLQLRLVN